MAELIHPRWPAPPSIRALSTTREGGCSRGRYATLNLADHVGDDPAAVARNRRLLEERCRLPATPVWLQQVHGCRVAECRVERAGTEADAGFADRPGRVCAVLTADCLPLLLCNRSGDKVAAVHAGWRGLAAGVIEAAIERFGEPGANLLAWLGPAIGPDAFEVGAEVRSQFLDSDPGHAAAFRPGRSGRWMADIYQLARLCLQRRGVGFIGGGDYCTVSDEKRFFSYRREGVTGRMASLVWIEDPDMG